MDKPAVSSVTGVNLVKDKVKTILEMVKFVHTVFALPVALMSAFLAAGGMPEAERLFFIILAMVGARNGAMAFNRIVDLNYDQLNPRTKTRHLPQGLLTVEQTWLFVAFCSALFFFAAYKLGRLPFMLSPLFLAVLYGYSFAKRFTYFSHVFLGLSLGLAPVGAWVAIRESFQPLPFALGVAVIFWVAGFDILYACQDVEFDKKMGLFSIPQRLGIRKALWVSALFHMLMVAILIELGYLGNFGGIYFGGLVLVGGILCYEHYLVRPHDLSRMNVAFCTLNGMISVLLLVITVADRVIIGG